MYRTFMQCARVTYDRLQFILKYWVDYRDGYGPGNPVNHPENNIQIPVYTSFILFCSLLKASRHSRSFHFAR